VVEAHRAHAQTAHLRTLVRNRAKHLKPAFPGSLRAVKQSDAESYVTRRIVQKAAPSPVNREMTVLKHIIRRAVA
jgi:hypothetical protein